MGEAPVYRFLPGVSRGEGLFLAVLRKHGESEGCLSATGGADRKAEKPKKEKRRGNKGTKAGAKQPSNIAVPLNAPESYVLRRRTDALFAVPERWADTYDAADAALKLMHAGVCLGTEKGKDIIPDQSLALSRQLAADAYPRVELGYADAVNYLRKEAVTLPDDTPRGFVLLTYRGRPIGFEKNIGNRANNLYPQEWRIKSSHVPAEELIIKN